MIYEGRELHTVFETSDIGVLAIAKSILQDAGIVYFTKGEEVSNLFTPNYGYNPLFNQVEIKVSREDKDNAIELLKDLLQHEE